MFNIKQEFAFLTVKEINGIIYKMKNNVLIKMIAKIYNNINIKLKILINVLSLVQIKLNNI